MKAYIKAIVLVLLYASDVLALTQPFKSNTTNVKLQKLVINLPYHSGELSYIYNGKLLDINGDGYPEFIVCGLKANTIPATLAPLFAFTNYKGVLLPSSNSPVSQFMFAGPNNLVTADFNQDGMIDLLVPDQGPDTGTFPGGYSKILTPTNTGTIVDSKSMPLTSNYTHDAAAADINGDGYPDVLEVNSIFGPNVEAARILINDKQGHMLESLGRLPTDVENCIGGGWSSGAFVDVNGDGYPDIVLGGDFNGVNVHFPNMILMNDSTGHFTKTRYYLPDMPLGPNSTTDFITTIDINKDGKPDLLLANNLWNVYPGGPNAMIQVLINNGDNTFKDITKTSGLNFASDVYGISKLIVADLNHDGIQDVIAVVDSTYTYSTIRVFLGKSDGTFYDATSTYYPDYTTSTIAAVDVADVDNNGYLDLVTLENTWTNQPTLTITYTVPVNNTKLHTLAKPLLEKLPTITTKEDDLLKLISKSQ